MKQKRTNKRVVIVGAGFGGLNAARRLGKKKGFDVTLIDARNHHLFQPLLYQVATAALSPADIAAPVRSILSGYKRVRVIMDRIKDAKPSANKVIGEQAEYEYDYLILACGARHSYFGHDEWEANAPGLKSLSQATDIRRRILLAFEEAEKTDDAELRRQCLTFAVIGGGPTGVELAGALGEITRFTLARDFRKIDLRQARVILIEGGERILPAFHEDLSARAQRSLEQLGVHVMTGSLVTSVTDKEIAIGKEQIPARTVIWAAGVAPNALNQRLNVDLDKQGRIVVDGFCSVPAHANIFVIGDQAHFEDEQHGVLPGLCPVAIQQGRMVADNLVRTQKGRPPRAFAYLDKGHMATIGRKKAVAEFRGLRLKGTIAWLGWLFVHIYYLIGFKNKMLVFLQWAWSYFTFKRGARLIVEKEKS